MKKNNFITRLIDQIKNQSNSNVLGSSLAYYIKPKNYEAISYGNSRIEPTTGEVGNLGGITIIGKKPKYNYLRTHTVHTHPLTFSDALKGIDTATGPLLHFMQPTQYVGAVRDAIEGKNPFISIIKGNSGFFDEQYAKEHPWISTFGNLIGDVGILTAPKTLSTIKAINDTQIARSNALSAEALRTTSNPSSSHIIGETVRTNVLGEPIVNEAAAWQNGQRTIQQMLYPKGILDDNPLITRGNRPYTSPQSSGWTDVYTRDPIMVRYNPDEIINPKAKPNFQLKLGDIAGFWQKYGSTSEQDLLKQGILIKRPDGKIAVNWNGKQYAYDIFKGNKQKVWEPPKMSEVVRETESPLLTGDERRIQVETAWNKAADDERFINLKNEHPLSTQLQQFSDVTNLTLQEQAQLLLSEQGLIEQPMLRYYLEQNPELMARVKRIANGEEGIPINQYTKKPDIIAAMDENGNPLPGNNVSLASVLAYYDKNNARIGSNSILTRDEPFIQTYRGSQPRLNRETLLPSGNTSGGGKASNGNIIFGAGDIMSAVNYAQPLTRDQFLYVMKFLQDQGMPITKANIDYGISVLDNIIETQINKGIKLGSLGKEFHHGLEVRRTGSNYGAGKLDVQRMPNMFELGSTPDPAEWSSYISDMTRYNRFFGPNQGYGGLRTLLMRRNPANVKKFNANYRPFNDLDNLEYNGKTYTDLMKLENALGTDSGFKGADVFNSYNPTLMNTYIAPLGTHFYGFGLKKGGKLLKRK